MRWSLIIAISTALLGLFSFSAYGLAIPSDVDAALVSRGRSRAPAVASRKKAQSRRKDPLSQGSAKDRKVSANHGHKYTVQNNKEGMKNWQADHIFEKQMVHAHLEANRLSWKQVPKKTKEKVNSIINGHGNLARIPGGVNGSKGSRVKNTILGNSFSQRPDRDRYMRQSYPQAKKVAGELDKAYKQGKLRMEKSAVEFLDGVWSAKGKKKKFPIPLTWDAPPPERPYLDCVDVSARVTSDIGVGIGIIAYIGSANSGNTSWNAYRGTLDFTERSYLRLSEKNKSRYSDFSRPARTRLDQRRFQEDDRSKEIITRSIELRLA
ncbi:hypothetical protein NMY22_g12877 [Coprinellus aureogranulatus]|nr:hypothetical protein NMY22_g12877 [Coprinellus aureogranulatus]